MKREDYAEFLRVLKEKNDIVDVIGANIKLERRGYGYWACCPFHHEKTPSFSINAADKYYHCFGCGASGDVISFVKEYENVDFAQAVQILAARVGLEVPAFDNRTAEEAAAKKHKKDRLSALMRDTARFYLNNLYAGRADEYLAYLERRKIAPSTMKKFGLGASLDFSSLPTYLLGMGYTAEECAESGACTRTPDGRLIDAEGERLIFPIINQLDEVIAFGGRLLKKSENRGKYTNTRETPLFSKGKNLYNINLVKKEKRAPGLDSLIMIEGYMDVISLYQAGFKGVVANMGTSLTKEQARLCKRYSENLFVCYDGDSAGQTANLRGLDIFKQEGLKVRVVPLPDGLDPDEVIRERGAEGYRECLERAMPVIDYRIYAAERKYDFSRTEDRREFVKEALAVVREAESETEREELLKRIAQVSQVSLSSLTRDLEKLPSAPAAEAAPPAPREDVADREQKAAHFVLAAALLSKPYALGCKVEEFGFTGDLKEIADFIARERATGRVRPSGIFDVLGADSKELSAVLGLDYGDNLDGAQAERYFRDCVHTLRRKALNERIEGARAAFSAAETQEERAEALKRIDEYTKELRKFNIGGRR